MNNSALARALEAAHNLDPDNGTLPHLSPPRAVAAVPPKAAAHGWLHSLWLRMFGPPAIDPRFDSRDFGVFRAFAEVGSDYLPSSGTWPSSTSDRS